MYSKIRSASAAITRLASTIVASNSELTSLLNHSEWKTLRVLRHTVDVWTPTDREPSRAHTRRVRLDDTATAGDGIF